MFEKEAEEYGNSFEWTNDDKVIDYSKKGFQKGAEFVYNKANEWHDLRKNPLDLPTRNCTVLIYTDWQGVELKTFFVDTRLFGNLTFREVIAWKEIVLPELKED